MLYSTDTKLIAPKSSETVSEVVGARRELAVRCRGLAKRFYYYEHQPYSLREAFLRFVARTPRPVTGPHYELTGFDLDIHRGESVALVGANGSGKSTLLRMIAGIYRPTEGVIETYGKIAAVIELGAGFHPELTGKENIDLYGAVMGLSAREFRAKVDEIVDFAGIGEFVTVPVKYYSSGMHARLAFAVTVCVEPDILLLDEVLAVGDASFREKCLDRLHTFQRKGGTLIVVSHDLSTVLPICQRGVWIDHGRIRMSDSIEAVTAAYQGEQG